MATGDQNDFASRLRSVLPAGWFAAPAATGETTNTPILDGLLAGIGNAWASAYAQLQAVAAQARLATAWGWGLDLLAGDFFGLGLQRRSSELDDAYRARIKSALLPDADTRSALIAALLALGCPSVTVFEPSNPTDTGGWDTGYLGWDMDEGGWGDVLPYQAFVTVTRPVSGGVSNIAGYAYGTGPEWAAGGWDLGALAWIDDSMIANEVTDQDIYDAINRVRPADSIIWTAITA